MLATEIQAILFEHNLQLYVMFTIFRNIHGYQYGLDYMVFNQILFIY